MVKGIKGFENSSHSSSVNCKKIACVMAASVVANILSQAIIFQDWPHFNAGITSGITSVFLFFLQRKILFFIFPRYILVYIANEGDLFIFVTVHIWEILIFSPNFGFP